MPRRTRMRQQITQIGRSDCNSGDLLPELQHTLAALADVEFQYEAARERLQQEVGPTPAQVELEARYRRERAPYLQRLEQLKHHIRFQLLSDL